MDDDHKNTQKSRILWMEPAVPSVGKSKRPWYQFRLIELFVVTTVACITFAALGAFGVNGTLDRIEAVGMIASPFLVLFEFWIWWQKHTTE